MSPTPDAVVVPNAGCSGMIELRAGLPADATSQHKIQKDETQKDKLRALDAEGKVGSLKSIT